MSLLYDVSIVIGGMCVQMNAILKCLNSVLTHKRNQHWIDNGTKEVCEGKESKQGWRREHRADRIDDWVGDAVNWFNLTLLSIQR